MTPLRRWCTIEIWNSRLFIDSFTTPVAIPTVFTGFWCAGTVWSTVGALSGHCGALCCHVVPGCVVCAGVKAMVAPGHDGALLCLLSPTPCPSLALVTQRCNSSSIRGTTLCLRRWCKILDLQLVFVFSLCWSTAVCLAQPCVGYC